jgi:hypothetical protein
MRRHCRNGRVVAAAFRCTGDQDRSCSRQGWRRRAVGGEAGGNPTEQHGEDIFELSTFTSGLSMLKRTEQRPLENDLSLRKLGLESSPNQGGSSAVARRAGKRLDVFARFSNSPTSHVSFSPCRTNKEGTPQVFHSRSQLDASGGILLTCLRNLDRLVCQLPPDPCVIQTPLQEQEQQKYQPRQNDHRVRTEPLDKERPLLHATYMETIEWRDRRCHDCQVVDSRRRC